MKLMIIEIYVKQKYCMKVGKDINKMYKSKKLQKKLNI